MNIKLIACSLLLSCLPIYTLIAQNDQAAADYTNYRIPPSPSASNLGEFGEYPVGEATGNPDITIPLGKAQSGALILPIELKYNASGIKVDQKASWVGLGWSLNAGGIVTRTVVGIADEHYNGRLNSPYLSADSIEPVRDHMYIRDIIEGRKDFAADEFSFSCGEMQGKFMFDGEGEVQLIPFNKEIKIECKINNYKIDSFILTNSHGHKYFFTLKEITQPRLFNEYQGEPITAWYLTRIESPNKIDYIELEYHNLGNRSYRIPSNTKHILHFNQHNCENCYTPEVHSDPYQGDFKVKYLRKLKSIHAQAGSIHFNHSENEREDDPNNNDVKLKTIEFFKAGSLYTGYLLEHSYFTSNGSVEKQYYKYRLKLNKLYQYGANNEKLPAFEFQYNATPLPPRYSSHVDHWGYANDNVSHNRIPKIKYKMPNGSYRWLGTADRSPDTDKMKAGSISSIQYPTGGRTVFEFEPHQVYHHGEDGHLQNLLVGGLRIASMKKYDVDNRLLEQKHFEYQNVTDTSKSSGEYVHKFFPTKEMYLSRLEVQREAYPTGHCMSCEIQSDIHISQSDILPQVLRNKQLVNYANVTVYNGNKSGSIYPFGRTVKVFSNPKDVYYPSYGGIGEEEGDMSWARGVLIEEKMYNKNNVLVAWNKQEYEIIDLGLDIASLKQGELYRIQWDDEMKQANDDPCLCPRTIVINGKCGFVDCGRDPDFVISQRYQFHYDYFQPVRWMRLKSSEKMLDGVEQKTTYEYATHFRHTKPIEIISHDIEGKDYFNRITYAQDLPVEQSSQDEYTSNLLAVLQLQQNNMNNLLETTQGYYENNQEKVISSKLFEFQSINEYVAVPSLKYIYQTESSSVISGFKHLEVSSSNKLKKDARYKSMEQNNPESTILQVNQKGEILSSRVTDQPVNSQKLVEIPVNPGFQTQSFTHFTITGANSSEALYSGFEPYENEVNFTLLSPFGKAGYCMPFQGQSHIMKVQADAQKLASYYLSYWVKANSNSSGKVQVRVLSDNSLVYIKNLNIESTNNQWQLSQHQVHLKDLEIDGDAEILIRVFGQDFSLDEVKLLPTLSDMQTYTYNQTGELIAESDHQEQYTYYYYDQHHRLFEKKDDNKWVIEAYSYQYADGLNRAKISTYQALEPFFNRQDLISASSDEVKITHTYLNGLGKVQQSILMNVQGLTDLVQPKVYNKRGKEFMQLMPFGRYTGGNFVEDAVDKQRAFYESGGVEGLDTTSYAFNQVIYDHDPLQRASTLIAPGSTWQNPIRHEKYTRRSNTTSDSIWSFTMNKFYPSGHLFVEEYKHTDSRVTVSYKNKLNQTIVQEEIAGNKRKRTYFRYNNKNLLVQVLKPKASRMLLLSKQGEVSISTLPGLSLEEETGSTTNTSSLEDAYAPYCFFYTYDFRDRVMTVKEPAKEKLRLVYNSRDQICLKKRGSGTKCEFIKYDHKGRKVQEGICHKYDYQLNWAHFLPPFETEGQGVKGYSNTAFPPLEAQDTVLIAYFYDDYAVPNQITSNEIVAPQDPEFPETTLIIPKGSPTLSHQAIMNGQDEFANQYLNKIMFYNRFRQQTAMLREGILGAMDIEFIEYHPVRKLVMRTKKLHTFEDNLVGIRNWFAYDKMDQVIEVSEKLNNEPKRILQRKEYNILGHTIHKKVGIRATIALHEEVYKYTERGWLKKINDLNNQQSLFALELAYNQPTIFHGEVSDGFAPKMDGIVSQVHWASPRIDATIQGYDLLYDPFNQLMQANHHVIQTGSSAIEDGYFSVQIEGYDLHGNMQGIKRWTKYNGNKELIDKLQFTYQNDQLVSATDYVGNTLKELGFTESVNLPNEYSYTSKGYLKEDLNLGHSFTYNQYNQVQTVRSQDGEKLDFIYLADGTLLAKVFAKSSTAIQNWNVLFEDIEYQGKKDSLYIQTIHHIEGHYWPTQGNNYQAEYHIKDHLGSVRVRFSDLNRNGHITSSEVKEIKQYYPFGMSWNTDNAVIDYSRKGYAGMDYLSEMGLNQYDFKARWYNPSVCRWSGVDPLATNFYTWNPYQYNYNAPFNYKDPTGLSSENATVYKGKAARMIFAALKSRYGSGEDKSGGPDPKKKTIIYRGYTISIQSNGGIHIRWMSPSQRRFFEIANVVATYVANKVTGPLSGGDLVAAFVEGDFQKIAEISVDDAANEQASKYIDLLVEKLEYEGYSERAKGIREAMDAKDNLDNVIGILKLGQRIGQILDSPPTQSETTHAQVIVIADHVYFSQYQMKQTALQMTYRQLGNLFIVEPKSGLGVKQVKQIIDASYKGLQKANDQQKINKSGGGGGVGSY